MADNPFLMSFEQLPATLPLFPLTNAVVMPGCQLPLNIFEPRYLNMVLDAMTENRLIGMVQPEADDDETGPPPLFKTGTAGRITFFHELGDGRIAIVLTGVSRFDIVEEVPTSRGYRRATVDWSRFRCDFEEASSEHLDNARPLLLTLLKTYFSTKHLETDWTAVERMEIGDLVNRLTCALPFEPVERQMLVEMVNVEKRTTSLMALLRCETLEGATIPPNLH